jgi:S-adenosylmethionine:tRNA ribosyltransferase-isomerase
VLGRVPAVAQEVVDAVADHGRRGAGALEALEPGVDAAPAGADEVDQQSEVVDARMALGEEVALETLQPLDGLVQEAADLRDVTCDGQHLGPEAVPNGFPDVARDRRLEPGCGDCESLELVSGSLEHGLQVRWLRPTERCLGDARSRPFQRLGVHGRRGYPHHRMDTSDLDYELPAELVAQHPVEPRDSSRLLVFNRASGAVEHRVFSELPELLTAELPVVNDTRVIPARLRVRRATGGRAEVLLVELAGGRTWEALVRPASRMRPGERLGPVELLEPLGEGRWLVRLDGEPDGDAPLPPYIREPLADPTRYQTVYAAEQGSAAAPTAGLHFTPALVERLDPVRVTLHVGLDTFRPVAVDRVENHALHGERYSVAPEAWDRISRAERVLAVGTTTVRVLETVKRTGELSGRTSLFITPGFEFRRVDALLTNFHLPRSTLLALVMAFVGVEETREIYRVAIAERYRFYSFGDAMLAV